MMVRITNLDNFKKFVASKNQGMSKVEILKVCQISEISYNKYVKALEEERFLDLNNETILVRDIVDVKGDEQKKVEKEVIDELPVNASAEDEILNLINTLVTEKVKTGMAPAIKDVNVANSLIKKAHDEVVKNTQEALADCKKANKIVENAMQVALSKIEEARPVIHIIKEQKSGKETQIDGIIPMVFKKVLSLAQGRRNILLVGPAGCGKSHLAEMVAKSLKLPFYFISVSAGMSESQLAGWLVPTGDGGKFEYRRANFIKAYEEGGIFLLDEIDAGDANTLTFINSALANSMCTVPNRAENPVAVRHKDFICIAAANTFGNGADRMYVGRNQLDAATLDRFRIGVVPMDYDANVEKALVAPEILSWGLKVRDILKRNKMRRIISTRFLRDLTLMKDIDAEEFGTKEHWMGILTEDWSEDERVKVRNVA